MGEIETQVLKLPGVRAGAVVVTEGDDKNRHLVAFCCGDRPLDPGEMQDQLRTALPLYMVPSGVHWRDTLPLTENGKIDRKALVALAGELAAAEQGHEGPATATEQWLAAAWADVLGIPREQIGRRDHFFDLGGTSLSALQLVIALERAVSFKDLAAHPTVAAQATLIEQRGIRSA